MNLGKLNVFSTKNMVKESLIVGEIPSNREAYGVSMRIAVPSVIEMVSLSLITMISTAMVGRIGPEAMAAVGLTNQPRMLFLAIFMALNVGVTAVVSRRKGAGDQKAAQLCTRQAIIMGVVISVILAAVAVITSRSLMYFAGAQWDTIDAAAQYFRHTSYTFPLSALTLTISAAQRGIGNTRVTMVVNVAANIANVLFHILLIEGHLGFPAMGIAGAALAINISAVVGFVMAVGSLLQKSAYLRVSHRDNWLPDVEMIKSIWKIGGNSIFEQICMRIGFFAYARIVAGLGTMAFASHMIGMQLMQLSMTFGNGIAVATTSLVGQMLGAKRPDLAYMYGKVGQRMAFIVSIGLCIFTVGTRFWFPSLFTEDLYVIAVSANLMFIIAAVQPIQTSQLVMAGCLRGSGDTRFVALTMLITVAIARPVFAIIGVFVLHWGLIGAWLSVIADQGLRLILLYGRFARGKWTEIKV